MSPNACSSRVVTSRVATAFAYPRVHTSYARDSTSAVHLLTSCNYPLVPIYFSIVMISLDAVFVALHAFNQLLYWEVKLVGLYDVNCVGCFVKLLFDETYQ